MLFGYLLHLFVSSYFSLFLIFSYTLIINQKSLQIHKHLGIILDSNLNYEHHIKYSLNKVNQTIGLLCKFQLILPRHSLITIYKIFIRPHLDYGDVIYDRAFNESFHQRLESIQ